MRRSTRRRTLPCTRARMRVPILARIATRLHRPTLPRTERRITMRTLLTVAVLCCLALATAGAQDFNWHGRIAAGKRLEVKGVNGDVRAVLASGAEAVVNARKHARRSDPDEVEIKVVESDAGITICAVYPTPARARRENTCEPGDHWSSSTDNNDVTVDFDVQVPAGIEFNGQTVNGEMSAEGLKADVRASTVNGSVRQRTRHHDRFGRGVHRERLGLRADGPRGLEQRSRVQHRKRRDHADSSESKARHRRPGQHGKRRHWARLATHGLRAFQPAAAPRHDWRGRARAESEHG